MSKGLQHWLTCDHRNCKICTYRKDSKESAWMKDIRVTIPQKGRK